MSYVHPQQRTKLVLAAARGYLGALFHHQGRHPKYMDCVGLLALSFADAGYKVDDKTTYSEQPNPEELIAQLELNFRKVEGPPKAANVLLLAMKKGKPQHVALYTEHGGIIHTWAGLGNKAGRPIGKVVEGNNDDRWLTRLHSVWEIREELWQQ